MRTEKIKSSDKIFLTRYNQVFSVYFFVRTPAFFCHAGGKCKDEKK